MRPSRPEPAPAPQEHTVVAEPERYHSLPEVKPQVPTGPRVVPSQTAGVYSIVKPEQQAEPHSSAKSVETVSSETETN